MHRSCSIYFMPGNHLKYFHDHKRVRVIVINSVMYAPTNSTDVRVIFALKGESELGQPHIDIIELLTKIFCDLQKRS